MLFAVADRKLFVVSISRHRVVGEGGTLKWRKNGREQSQQDEKVVGGTKK